MYGFIGKNYLNQSRDNGGRGSLIMGKTSDGKIIAALVNSNGEIAVSGAGSGDATAANQVLEIAELQNVVSELQTITNNLITQSTTESITLTAGPDSLTSFTGCKKVTILNDTGATLTINLNSSNDSILADGYAVDLYTTDPANIEVTGTNGSVLSYIVYS